MRNAQLDELQTGIKIGRRNINNLRYVDDTTLMAESKEGLKSLLVRVKEEEDERASLRLNSKKKKDHGIQPHYCVANRRGNVEVVTHTAVRTDKPKQCVEKQRHYSANEGPYS